MRKEAICRTPHRGARIEIIYAKILLVVISVAPHIGVRGLKLKYNKALPVTPAGRTPHRGARIEIVEIIGLDDYRACRTPHRGARIEIGKQETTTGHPGTSHPT